MAVIAMKKAPIKENVIMGSLAHEYNWEAHEHEFSRAGQSASIPLQNEDDLFEAAVGDVAKEEIQVIHRVSIVSILGFAGVIVMAVITLLCYVQLTAISTQVVKLKDELSALQTQNITLTADYEQMFDLATVKEAATTYGMTKPSPSQIYYIDLSGGDNAVVYDAPSSTTALGRIMDRSHQRVDMMLEYFG